MGRRYWNWSVMFPVILGVSWLIFICLVINSQSVIKDQAAYITELEWQLEKCQLEEAIEPLPVIQPFQDIKMELIKTNAKFDVIGLKLMQVEVAETLRIKR